MLFLCLVHILVLTDTSCCQIHQWKLFYWWILGPFVCYSKGNKNGFRRNKEGRRTKESHSIPQEFNKRVIIDVCYKPSQLPQQNSERKHNINLSDYVDSVHHIWTTFPVNEDNFCLLWDNTLKSDSKTFLALIVHHLMQWTNQDCTWYIAIDTVRFILWICPTIMHWK